MATEPAVRDAAHQRRLNANCNEGYWRATTARIERKAKTLTFIVAFASGSVAISSWTIWSDFPWLWKIIAGIGAVSSVLNLVYDYKTKVIDHAILHAKWLDQRTEAETLWLRIEAGETVGHAEVSKLMAREAEIEKGESKIPLDLRLKEECYQSGCRICGSQPLSREQRGLPPL